MPLSSLWPDVPIPDVPVAEYVFAGAAARAGQPAIVDGRTGQQVTYGDLVDRIDLVAGALRRLGIGARDVVAIMGGNSWRYAVAAYAVLRTGAALSPVNTLYRDVEVTAQLRGCRARLVFADSALAGRVRGVPVIGIDAPIGPDGRSLDALARRGRGLGPVDVDPDGVALLPYSSGTSGVSKGVLLTHRNVVANMCQTAAFMTGLTERSRVLGLPPFFHIYGAQIVLNMTLWAGACIVTLGRFDLDEFLATIDRHGTDRVNVSPPVLTALAKDPRVDAYDLSALRYLFSGAAPLAEPLAEQVRQRLGCRIRQGYGMTELSPASHAVPDDRDDLPVTSVGLAVPNLTCRVVDPLTGLDVAPGQPGELWCRGPNVMRGYLDDPTATADAIDAEGYLHTGDLVRYDDDRVFTVLDRLKELIKYKGHQVAPAELEAVLLHHPDIEDAAVVGRPDPVAGEIPVAVVVLRAGAQLTERAVTDFVADHVAPHKRIRSVRFVDGIPKSLAGKVLRRQLR